MRQPWVLMAMIAPLFGAAAVGVQLGEAAVADIDPLYFSGQRAGSSFAALTPHGPARLSNGSWQGPQITGPGDHGSSCIRCPDRIDLPNPDAAEQFAAGDPAPWQEPAAVEMAAIAAPLAAERDEARALIEVYARYPVTAEEEVQHQAALAVAIAEQAAPAPEPAADEPPAEAPISL